MKSKSRRRVLQLLAVASAISVTKAFSQINTNQNLCLTSQWVKENDPSLYRTLVETIKLEFDAIEIRNKTAFFSLLDKKRIYEDYKNDNVEIVDGWVIARSEVCASIVLDLTHVH